MNTVRIVSPDNPHAIAAYALPVAVAIANLWKGAPPPAMVEIVGFGPSLLVMLLMIAVGVAGAVGAWTASRVADPLLSLRIEVWSVGLLAAILAFYIVTLLIAYEPASVATSIAMTAAVAGGSLWRMVQLIRDIRRIKLEIKTAQLNGNLS